MSPRPPDAPQDPYGALGVSAEASQAEITAAYRRAVRACHPDVGRPDRDRLAAVIAAYQCLRDPERRAAYDRQQRSDRGSGAVNVAVRVHRRTSARAPDLRAGPVRYHGFA